MSHTAIHKHCSPRLAVLVAIAATILLWGSAFVAIRSAAPSLGSGSLVSARLLLGAGVFALLARPLRIGLPSVRQLPLLAAIAASGLVGYLLLLSAGEARAPAGVSAMIFAAAPVLVVLLARLTLGERLTARSRCGIVIALAGTITVSAAQGLGGGGSPLGALLVLAAVCCYAPWVILSKRAVQTMRSHEIAAWSTWLAAIMTLPLGIHIPDHIAAAQPKPIAATLFLGLVVTTVPLVLWTWVLGRVPAAVASSSLLLIGPCAVLIAWIVLAETPSLAALLGGAVTLGGVTLIQQRPAGGRPNYRSTSARASVTRDKYRAALEAHPEMIVLPSHQVRDGRVRVAEDDLPA